MFNKPAKPPVTGRATPIVTSVDTLPPPIPTPIKRPVVSAPSAPVSSSSGLRMGNAPSVISSDMAVKGSIMTSGDVQVDGILEGDIQAGKLMIGDGAQVFGEIIAESIEVRGRVVGAVRARKTHLYSSAHIEGDIITAVFAVESGAFFDGRCKHDQDPLKGLIAQVEPQHVHMPEPETSSLSFEEPVAAAAPQTLAEAPKESEPA